MYSAQCEVPRSPWERTPRKEPSCIMAAPVCRSLGLWRNVISHFLFSEKGVLIADSTAPCMTSSEAGYQQPWSRFAHCLKG
ncbi:hypothetical protein M404DRAFT_1001772 [Pisolithus tinctorius Marx 270]|uniref:Uncharacterized protein n=1 Tax=Pisolithus tinctorius Marx 270 TaxID=870435 RepID=A0A0C3P6X6_PISTI|nr:hypothetical protein M404DRAFT_1001772 [Pisolithus tinctorius Marx 270]